jgi:segregation and condensation protein A
VTAVALVDLELDLDLFTGPFDLLLTLVLREEIDLLELSLADVVLAYLDHLEARGELDLESATEFIVLIAALLELKSRLMLLGEEDEELEIEPDEAADELLARMLAARRYRAAASHLGTLLESERGHRFREAPLPVGLRRTLLVAPEGSEDAEALGAAIGRLLAMPPEIDVRHVAVPRVAVAERLALLRGMLRRGGSFSFEEAVRGADRMTVAVTLFALLELYKRGEADWEQDRSFGEIDVHAPAPRGAGAASLTGAGPLVAGAAQGAARLAG